MGESKDTVKIVMGLSFLVFMFLWAFTYDDSNALTITTYMEKEQKAESMPVKIVRQITKAVSDALFDIILTIPEKSKLIEPGEELLVSIELINFGGPGRTPVAISYIITDSDGNLVLIEHEDRIVLTQMSFLKTIELPELPRDNYKLFVEMLYSNTSAITTGEFRVVSP